MNTTHPQYYDFLKKKNTKMFERIPRTLAGFGKLHASAMAAGVLDSKTKELIALSIGISVSCNGCVSYHVHDALKAGATEEEILETIGVAIMMGGGPAMVYGCEAMQAMDEFRAEQNTV